MRTAFLILLFIVLALFAAGMTSCTGTITSPYTGNSYDFSIKPRPGVVVKPEPATVERSAAK